MSRKLPVDAFDFYYGLGPGRSYSAVATKYEVSKRAVTSLAVREKWQAKIVEFEHRARVNADTKVVESIEAMHERHLKTLSAVTHRALEALRNLPLASGMEAVRAIEMVIRQERTIRGEPGEQSALSIEAIIKREYADWMVQDAAEPAQEKIA